MVLRATACLLALLLVTGLAAEEDACEAVPTNATALLQTPQLLGSHVEKMRNGQALGVFLNVQTCFVIKKPYSNGMRVKSNLLDHGTVDLQINVL